MPSPVFCTIAINFNNRKCGAGAFIFERSHEKLEKVF